MYAIAIANFKGGVGKSATTHNLGAVLADCGRHVLLIDCDPQGSLTASCGVRNPALSLSDVLGDSRPGNTMLDEIIVNIAPQIDLVPADITLAKSEATMQAQIGNETVLRRAMTKIATQYDVALLDCPPNLGILTTNALAAANGVLVPTQPSGTDLRGLVIFVEHLEAIRAALNPALSTLGVLVTFYDDRYIHDREAVAAMERAGLRVLPIKIGRTQRIKEAATLAQPVVTYEPTNAQAIAYREIGKGIDRWLSQKIRPER